MLTELQKRKCMHTFKLWDNNGDGRIAADDNPAAKGNLLLGSYN